MFLFARNGTMKQERSLDAVAFATEICGQVSGITGLEVHAWSALYGAELTSVSWTCLVESHAAMGAAGEKLQADPGYMARVGDAAELFATAPEDTLAEVVATVNDTDELGSYASVVTAQCAPGKIAEAMGWGVDIFNHVGKVTGRPGILCRGVYGPWATMAWITIADSLDQIDAAETAMGDDPTYVETLDQGGSLFQPGSAESRLTRRLV